MRRDVQYKPFGLQSINTCYFCLHPQVQAVLAECTCRLGVLSFTVLCTSRAWGMDASVCRCQADLAALTQLRIELRVTRNCLRAASTPPPAQHTHLVFYPVTNFSEASPRLVNQKGSVTYSIHNRHGEPVHRFVCATSD
jgi:hypothetical protein